MEYKKEAEGKTKIIWSTDNRAVVLVESKDDITAGDGERRDVIGNKGALATETTSNCFTLLNRRGVSTHFISRVDERNFYAKRVKMIPVELVVRRIATGSYLKRHPATAEGTVFNSLVFEAFFKDDELHDPLMFWNERRECFELHGAKAVLGRGYIFDLNPKVLAGVQSRPLREIGMERLRQIACDVFLILEEVWKKEWNVVLVDLKIECGRTLAGSIVVADVIDNDSWRIWPGGDKSQMKDKQVYRDSKAMTDEVRETLKDNYAWVAEATKKFVQ